MAQLTDRENSYISSIQTLSLCLSVCLSVCPYSYRESLLLHPEAVGGSRTGRVETINLLTRSGLAAGASLTQR